MDLGNQWWSTANITKRKTMKHNILPGESTQWYLWNILAAEQIECEYDKASRADYYFPKITGTRGTYNGMPQEWNERNPDVRNPKGTINKYIIWEGGKKKQEEGGLL